MSNKRLSSDEALSSVFKSVLDCTVTSDKLYVEHLNNQIGLYEHLLNSKKSEEPLSFFKKAHAKWEAEIKELEDKLFNAYEKLGSEITEQQEFYYKLRNTD